MSSRAFSKYSEYKNSEFDWLGELPSHWGLKPLKHLCSFTGGSTPSKENRRYWDRGTVPWVSPKDMKVFWLSRTQDKITESAVVESSVCRVEPGALLMVVRSGILQRTIPVAINTISVTLNQDMKALNFGNLKRAQFFAYLVQGHVSSLVQRWTKEGATVESVEHEFLANDSVPCMPNDELQFIVAFLDYETAKIDALIEKQQQLIALLKEKRQAVISHAVTKGLNADAPMRDSGVEWLGEVPAHWKVTPFKHHIRRFEQGWSPQCDQRPAEKGEWGVLKVGCVNGGIFDRQENKLLPDTLAPRLEYLIKNGDLLISRANTRELVGSAAVVNEDAPKLLLCDKLYRLQLDELSDAKFASHYLHTSLVRQQIELEATGASHSMQNIGQGTIRNLPVPMPPVAEANEIVATLGRRLAILDLTIEKGATQVELLKERRTALISAAVTGKIDVRGWKPPQSATEAEIV